MVLDVTEQIWLLNIYNSECYTNIMDICENEYDYQARIISYHGCGRTNMGTKCKIFATIT